MAARFDALEKLRNKIMEAHHDYRAGADLFSSLNTDKIARDMEIEEKGASRGERDQPPSNQKGLDELELAIIERVQDEKRSAHQLFEDQLQLYAGRIGDLNFEEQFGLLQQANASSLSDFKGEIAIGLDTLHAKRTDLREATKELEKFRTKHRLERVARLQEGSWHWFKVSLVVFLFVFETYLNGIFLAKGSDQGFLGGVTEAFAFSSLNIGVALLCAIFCARQVTHRNFARKLVGAVSIMAYVCFAFALNLLLAHYREISGSFIDGAGRVAISRLWQNPFGLSEVQSWMLFMVGLLFSVVAFIDGWYFLDPYPGYAGVEKRRRKRRDDYTGTKTDLIDRLKEVRDDHNEKVGDILRELGSRRKEHSAILASRSRLLSVFNEHQDVNRHRNGTPYRLPKGTPASGCIGSARVGPELSI